MTETDEFVQNPAEWDWDSFKRDLKQKIHTYPLVGLVVHEGIQNAVDSFFDLDTEEFIKRDTPNVSVEFDLENNQIIIKDNGTGIHINKLNDVMKTNFSPKGTLLTQKVGELPLRRALKGSQGIGIKLTMFCTKSFSMRSVYSDEGANKAWQLNLEDWFNLLQTAEGPGPFAPKFPSVDDTDDEPGTTLTYQIHPEFQHQETQTKFTLDGFISNLIEEELMRQSIRYKDDKVTFVSKENSNLPDFEVDQSVGEILTRALIYGGTTRYLLDLNHNLIIEDDIGDFSGKIKAQEEKIESYKSMSELPQDMEDELEKMEAMQPVLEGEHGLRLALIRSGKKPPQIELNVSINSDESDLVTKVMDLIKKLSNQDQEEVEETEEE